MSQPIYLPLRSLGVLVAPVASSSRQGYRYQCVQPTAPGRDAVPLPPPAPHHSPPDVGLGYALASSPPPLPHSEGKPREAIPYSHNNDTKASLELGDRKGSHRSEDRGYVHYKHCRAGMVRIPFYFARGGQLSPLLAQPSSDHRYRERGRSHRACPSSDEVPLGQSE